MTRREWQKLARIQFEIMDQNDIHAVLYIHAFGDTATLLGKQILNVFDLCQATIPKPFFGRTYVTADWSKNPNTRTVRNQVYVEMYTDGAMPEESLADVWRWVVMTAITGGCDETVNILWQHDAADRIAQNALSEPSRTSGQPIGLKDLPN